MEFTVASEKSPDLFTGFTKEMLHMNILMLMSMLYEGICDQLNHIRGNMRNDHWYHFQMYSQLNGLHLVLRNQFTSFCFFF